MQAVALKGDIMDWKKEAIGYQIYPRSFMDSNGDGIGDLRGIISKLDYLKDLGIDVIWICPMYKSPNDDNGYDISDYEEILDEFGTMEDFDELLNEVHGRGMKLIIDLVINHTSDEHEWFLESRTSKDSKKRDWYIWREGKDGQEPNNWESIFSGSVWEYDEVTDEYFMHLFSKRQPDLNWENKEVRRALYDMINGWLDKGIDGFRVDAISHIKKEEGLKDLDNPKGLKYVSSFSKHMNVKGIHTYLQELKENTFDKYDIMTVGEANGVSAKESHLWVGEKEGKFDMIFQFEHLELWDKEGVEDLDVITFKKTLSKWQDALYNRGWNALFIENHDITRAVSKWGNDKNYWLESAKALGLMYFMQQGTPFIYQGQEIGMTNVAFDSIEAYNDVSSVNKYNEMIAEGVQEPEAMKFMWNCSRDNARTPMQWDGSVNAGFTTGIPWIGINPNYVTINVKAQQEDKDSILNFYKEMIKIRKSNKALVYGKYQLIWEEHPKVYAYTRGEEDEKYLVLCNLTDQVATLNGEILEVEDLLLANYKVEEFKQYTTLRPYEARLYKLK